MITFGLFNNTAVKKIDLSGNSITHEGAVILSDCLKDNHTLQKLDISYNRIADIGIIAIGDCLKHKNALKELNPSHNNIKITGMSHLSECIKYATSLEYVDLSGNLLSPWGVYCAIIRHCYVDSLTFCGDKGIKEFVKVITDSLQTNTKLQSLTLYKIGKTGLQSIRGVLCNNTTLKELNLSWMSKGTMIIIHRNTKRDKINSTRSLASVFKEVMVINILYDSNHECTSEAINMSNKNINDDAVYLIMFGLHNNTTVQKIDLSYNYITENGVAAISGYLKCNKALKELNLSQNYINFRGMNVLSKCIKSTIPLTYVDLSGNYASPWGVYCTIIRHCCVNSLTFCGDEGMKEYIREIINSLQTNAILQFLTLYKIGRIRLHSVKDILGNNSTLKELNVTWMSKGTNRKITFRKAKRTGSHIGKMVTNINILYDGDHECTYEAIIISKKTLMMMQCI